MIHFLKSTIEQFSKHYLTYDTDRLTTLEGALENAAVSVGAISWSWAPTMGEVFYLLPGRAGDERAAQSPSGRQATYPQQ